MPDVPPSSAPAGWFPDGSGQLRYWDGSAWTHHVAPMVDGSSAVQPSQTTAKSARAAKRASAKAASGTTAITARASAEPATAAAPAVPDARPSRHPAATWIIGSIAALVVLISTAAGGVGAMFVSLGLVALATGLYPLLTGRPSWIPVLATRPRSSATAAGAILLLIIGAAVPVAASAPASRQASVATASPTPSPTPPPTPTPAARILQDVASKPALEAAAVLREGGYTVGYVLESGEATTLTDGMTVKSQSPAPGVRLPAGSVVTLTLLAPAPAPAVDPTPAPAPAPAAPKPAPKPAAPAQPKAPAAPAPSKQTGLITPGAYCSNADVGRVAQAENGRSYTCGGKGPDKKGKNHWNAM